ncbi:MAG: metallophosphoesterase [Clostridia bacterium]|nr:metallophosphoesterase [Clostridia bacterium]
METFNLLLVTDTHYFASKLGCRGEAYREFMRFEQKCFAETQSINNAAFALLNETELADTVLIAGDLSFNGEKESHLEFLELLKNLKAHGKRVFVITAGHDFNDHPFAFDETGRLEPEGTKREELFDLYYDYGFSDAIAVDRASLSYVAQLAPGLRLLALNNDGNASVGHTYPARQIEWILRQTKKAREEGQTMIAMNHYPLLPGVPLFSLLGNEVVMKNADFITTMLADEGVHLCFTGHMHNMAINEKITEKGNRFYDVCTGSLIGHPAGMRLVSFSDGYKTAEIRTLPIPAFDWDFGGLTQEEYLQRQFDSMITEMLTAMRDDPTRFLNKIGMKNASDGVKNIVARIGARVNSITVGEVCRLARVSCDDSIRDLLFKDLARDLVRHAFEGDMPYVKGTPEYDAVMGVIGRFSPILKNVKINGKSADLYDMIEKTIGKYGLSDTVATLTLC